MTLLTLAIMAKIALSVMTVVLILDPADKKKSRNLSEATSKKW